MISELTPQEAAGKVLWHFSMSLDGFVAGTDHAMDWMGGLTNDRETLIDEYVATTGAIIGGRAGYDIMPGARPYSDDWQGAIFILTHHPEDAEPADDITFLNCDVAEAIRIALDAAGGKNVEIFSPTIGAQALERGLIDEIDLHIAPVLLGDGIRLYGPGKPTVRLDNLLGAQPTDEVNVRFAPRR